MFANDAVNDATILKIGFSGLRLAGLLQAAADSLLTSSVLEKGSLIATRFF